MHLSQLVSSLAAARMIGIQHISYLAALLSIHQAGTLPIGHLCKTCNLTGTAATNIADFLEKAKLATRSYGKQDRRKIWLTLTETGTATAQAILQPK